MYIEIPHCGGTLPRRSCGIIETQIQTASTKCNNLLSLSIGGGCDNLMQKNSMMSTNNNKNHNHHQPVGGTPSSQNMAAIISPKLTSTEMEDLINLPGPLTEDAVMRTLNARFKDNKHFVSRKIFF